MIRTLRAQHTRYTNTHLYSLYSEPWCHLHAGGVVVGVVVHHAVAADLLLAHAALLLVRLKHNIITVTLYFTRPTAVTLWHLAQ